MQDIVKQEIKNLRKKLLLLKQKNSVIGVKGGTEVEDMTLEELSFLRELSEGIIPLTVKIGGAEARQDIRMMIALHTDCILAPMIESVYALTRFVEAVQDMISEKKLQLKLSSKQIIQKREEPKLAFNLETITAVSLLDNFIESQAFSFIDQVTLGRDDLSRSMHLNIDDNEVIKKSQKAIRKIKNQGKYTSLGGGLSLKNIKRISETIESDYLNTRNVTFKNDKNFKKKPENNLFQILNWEKSLYSFFIRVFPKRSDYYDKRIKILSERCSYLSQVVIGR